MQCAGVTIRSITTVAMHFAVISMQVQSSSEHVGHDNTDDVGG